MKTISVFVKLKRSVDMAQILVAAKTINEVESWIFKEGLSHFVHWPLSTTTIPPEDSVVDFDFPAQQCALEAQIRRMAEPVKFSVSRDEYTERLAAAINLAMEKDSELRLEAIIEGRTGLHEMTDEVLVDLGVDSYGVQP